MEKDEILEYYMNTIFFGRNAYGVKTAALTYFGKDLTELNLAECATIAGITNNPSLYDPFRFPENAKKRQEVILKTLLEHGKISKEEYDEAIKAPLDYKHAENKKELETPQSYFIDNLMTEVINDLVNIKGFSKKMATDMVYFGGLKIYSTVDLKVQKALETVYENEANVPGIKGKNGKMPQSAMVILDPYTAQIKGIVGGKGVKKESRGLNRAAGTYRSPGSAIKPLSIYAPAIDQGLINPYSVFTDMPINVLNGKLWPINSTNGGDYSGQMTIHYAVEESINTIAIKILELLTPEKSFEYMTQKLGFKQLIAKQVHSNGKTSTDIALAPLALGGLTKGVSVLEMAAGYATFVNDGMYIKPTSYTKILDSNGNVLLENKLEASVAFENSKTSFYVNDMLKNVIKNGTGRAADLGRIETAGKTGSTSENNDRWFVGYTPYYVGATWYGYDEQQRVSGAGANPSVTLWKMVMDLVHKDLPSKKFKKPEGFVTAKYCRDSGLSPTQWCETDVRGSRVASGYYFKGDAPTESCNIHTGIEIDTETKMAASEFCPPENRKIVGIMDLTRLFKAPLTLRDGDFALTITNPPVGTGIPSNGKGEFNYKAPCTEHTHDTTIPEEPQIPPDTDFPEYPPDFVPPEEPSLPIEPPEEEPPAEEHP